MAKLANFIPPPLTPLWFWIYSIKFFWNWKFVLQYFLYRKLLWILFSWKKSVVWIGIHFEKCVHTDQNPGYRDFPYPEKNSCGHILTKKITDDVSGFWWKWDPKNHFSGAKLNNFGRWWFWKKFQIQIWSRTSTILSINEDFFIFMIKNQKS